MGRRRRQPRLGQQVYAVLNPMYLAGHGQSKHADKRIGKDKVRIYSKNTYETYMRECKAFANWCKVEYGCKTLAQCKEHIEDYLRSQLDKSAWTVSTKAAAICKMYQIPMNELNIELPKRQREDIKRSREEVGQDKHISAETKEVYGSFTRCVGCRLREMKALKGTDIRLHNGRYYVHIRNGKGGKERYAPVIGSEQEIKEIERLFEAAGNGLLFPAGVPKALDNHNFRGEYAKRLYRLIARDTATLDSSELYRCRKDKLGIVYDKKAMSYVSKALGHNRIDVIAGHYI